MDKRPLIEAFRAHLESTVDALRASRDAARSGTRVDGDHRGNNRGERASITSAGYLAAGLEGRLREAEQALALLDRVPVGACSVVAAGALVSVEQDGSGRRFCVLPGAQGEDLGDGVVALSPRSPLVRALVGCSAGDEVELELRGEEQLIEVLEVC